MKRAFDLIVLVLALPILLPVLVLLVLLVRLNLGSPVFFRQKRPGYSGNIFEMIKFRTMTNDRDSENNLLADSERLTRFGKLLRSTSLDELPELWNVLRGEMSLIGPRPLLIEYLPLYSREQARRHEVLPGLTGWAQVNGRNNISWDEKFKLDIWYVDHRSVLLDMKILLLTIMKVFKSEGISQKGHVTMEKFKGSKN